MTTHPITLLPTEEKRKASLQWILARPAAERGARFSPQRWRDISCFLADFNLIPGKHRYWRLTEVLLGQIHGLPGSRGFLVATDGIECYILQGDNILFKGHMASFVKEPLENISPDFQPEKLENNEPKAPRKKREYKLEIYD